jgi:hypothetical protein
VSRVPCPSCREAEPGGCWLCVRCVSYMEDMDASGVEPDAVTYGALLHVLASAGRCDP